MALVDVRALGSTSLVSSRAFADCPTRAFICANCVLMAVAGATGAVIDRSFAQLTVMTGAVLTGWDGADAIEIIEPVAANPSILARAAQALVNVFLAVSAGET